MLSHVERHPVSCVIASISGLAGGAAKWLHIVSGYAADISSVLGAIITIVTAVGMIRSWMNRRRGALTTAVSV